MKGAKPKLEERGPYVYKAVYIKDTEGMIWSDDSTDLTYRPRRFYTYVPELSGEGLDPYRDVVTVPNIPLWTGLSKVLSLEKSLKYEQIVRHEICRYPMAARQRSVPHSPKSARARRS